VRTKLAGILSSGTFILRIQHAAAWAAIRAYIDADEALRRRTLYKRTTEGCMLPETPSLMIVSGCGTFVQRRTA